MNCTGDVRILSRLLEREHAAHKAFGESSSLLGLHSAELEEKDIEAKLSEGVDADDAIPEQPEAEFDLLALLAGATGSDDRGTRLAFSDRDSGPERPPGARRDAGRRH